MRGALWFSLGVFLACCLFWPSAAFSVDCIECDAGSGTWSWGAYAGWYCGTGTADPTCSSFPDPIGLPTVGPKQLSASYTCASGSKGLARYPNTSVSGKYDLRYRQWNSTAATACVYEPPECQDGQWSIMQNEEGIDCGGDCDAPCERFCPDGSTNWGVAGSNDQCWTVVPTDPTGNCPSGYSRMTVSSCPAGGCPGGLTVGTRACYYDNGSVWAANTNLVPDASPPAAWSPNTNYDYTTTNNTPVTTNNVDTSTTTTNETNNTSTTTTVSNNTVVNNDNTVTTTKVTTTTVYNTTNNQMISRDTVTDTTTKSPLGNDLKTTQTQQETFDENEQVLTDETITETFDFAFSPPGYSELPFSVESPDNSRFATRFTEFTTAVQGAAIYAPLFSVLSPSLGSGASSVSLSMGTWGTETIDLADYASVWESLKYLLLFSCLLVSARLIIANK